MIDRLVYRSQVENVPPEVTLVCQGGEVILSVTGTSKMCRLIP